jgi:hypothetical protein
MGPIIAEGTMKVNTIVGGIKRVPLKKNSCKPIPDSGQEKAPAYLGDLGGLSRNP